MEKLFSLGCMMVIGIIILLLVLAGYVFFEFLLPEPNGCITENCAWFD